MKLILYSLIFLFFVSAGQALIADKAGSHGMSIGCTNSMYPNITCENTLNLKFRGYDFTPAGELNFSIGDVVFYSPTTEQRFKARQRGFWIKTTYLIHRIISKVNGTYIIKGDNNDFTDNEYFGTIQNMQIRYKVV